MRRHDRFIELEVELPLPHPLTVLQQHRKLLESLVKDPPGQRTSTVIDVARHTCQGALVQAETVEVDVLEAGLRQSAAVVDHLMGEADQELGEQVGEL